MQNVHLYLPPPPPKKNWINKTADFYFKTNQMKIRYLIYCVLI